MKRLRILTGRHVGACLDLEPGRHTLGRGADCDVLISDWPGEDMCVTVGDDGAVSMLACGSGAAASSPDDSAPSEAGAPFAGSAHEPIALLDFEPHTFGEVVLCVGSVEGPWPANLELLGDALQTGVALRRRLARVVAAQLRRAPVRALLGSVALGGLALALTPLLPSQSSLATPHAKPSLAQVQLQLLRALEGAGAPALSVQAHQDAQTLEIAGLLDTTDKVGPLRAAINGVASPYPVIQRYSAADTLANDIHSAVGLAGAEVQHRGDGVFVFKAEVKDLAAARAAIDRVARDLSPLVKGIEQRLVLLETAKTELPILSAMTVGRVSVIQTRDGNKHIVMGAPEPALSVADALLIRPPNR